MLWIIVSIFLLQYLHGHHPSPQFLSAITLIPLVLFANMFINNSDFFVANSDFESATDIKLYAQQLLHTWHFVLRLSGGDLKVKK